MLNRELFESHIDRSGGQSACHPWTASRTKGGYGQLTIGRKADRTRRHVYAHRVAYELAHGPIPAGMFVCHRCDNPGCVNPAHLFAGSNADNVADMVAKGRDFRGVRPRGERHHMTRTTAADVRVIRTRRAAGERLRVIGDDYGLDITTVSDIVRRKSWGHIE